MSAGSLPNESILAYAQRLKAADREWLSKMQPSEAQELVDQVLHPSAWTVADLQQLAWPGDLGDELELPEWASEG